MLNTEHKTQKWISDHINYDGDECLPWPFSLVRGYGQLVYLGKFTRASRVMCIVVHGQPPSAEHHAAHECGNSACVNPRHLTWKTPSENQMDKRRHDTFYRGGRRKRISFFEAEKIRSMAGSKTHDEIGLIYGVSRRNIGMIMSGKAQTEPSCREMVLAALAAGAPLDTDGLMAATGIAVRSSISAIVSKMVADAQIERVSPGLYKIRQSTQGK